MVFHSKPFHWFSWQEKHAITDKQSILFILTTKKATFQNKYLPKPKTSITCRYSISVRSDKVCTGFDDTTRLNLTLYLIN